MSLVSRRRIQLPAPGSVDVITEDIKPPKPDELLVRTQYSAISPGTERLVYEGHVPDDLAVDASIEALTSESFSYPLSYGYACVGDVERVGEEVGQEWEGASVFAFQPHVSRFVAKPETLVRLPDSVRMTDAVMIPSVETAVNLVMDGRPMIGETAVVFGLGVVGLLTTRLLGTHPLSSLVTVDPVDSRRQRSLDTGASVAVAEVRDAIETDSTESNSSAGDRANRADLVFELTGTPSVLNDAIEATGFGGRLVVGSWYGSKAASIDLGGHFHRSRMQIISSQVSTIAPEYTARWTKSRRMSVVLDLLPEIEPSTLISDRHGLDKAAAAYRKLGTDRSMLQPIFVYE